MVVENKYLKKAVQKSGFVIMVKSYAGGDRTSKLEYISPNAVDIGMNVVLLRKGLKLTEDYIHPEDRELVINTMYNAAKSNLNEYVHEYRMVGDDGTVYNVTNEICVSEIDGDDFIVEYYIKKAKKDSEKAQLPSGAIPSRAAVEKAYNAEIHGDFGEKENSNVYNITKSFSEVTNLYSVLVNVDGKVIFPPTGPATNLGDFYDLFEKPAYKEYYKKIKEHILNCDEPSILDREEGGIGKISPAPIKCGDRLLAFWMLGSYTQEETDRLDNILESQWDIAGMISNSISQKEIISNEVAKSRGVGIKLREELNRQNIINDVLTKTAATLKGSVDDAIEETLREVGMNLNADKAFFYIIKSSYHKHNRLRSYWDADGGTPESVNLSDLPEHIPSIIKVINENSCYVADGVNQTEKAKLALLRHGFKAFVCVPLYRGNDIYALMFFADCRTTRVWNREEIRFMKSVALVTAKMLEEVEGKDNVRRVNEQLIDSFNSFKVGVFVRDAISGEVFFSNTAMNGMLGYDFTGRDSREIITDLRDRFDNIDGMRKPFITKNKIANWRKYVEALGGIVDITEILIDWINGEPASLIIIREAKD